jgi:hypothetical protein
MLCFLCGWNSITSEKVFTDCSAFLPPRVPIEILRITREAAAPASTVQHTHFLPPWTGLLPAGERNRIESLERATCIVTEVEAFGIKVLVVICENGRMTTSARSMVVQGGGTVARKIL